MIFKPYIVTMMGLKRKRVCDSYTGCYGVEIAAEESESGGRRERRF